MDDRALRCRPIDGEGVIPLHFELHEWSAWAPGIDTRALWQDWAKSPSIPRGTQTPALADVPAMQRRRLSRLGRGVAQVVRGAQGSGTCPMVFASRYGDVERALGAVESMQAGEPVSPADFAGSVHNAISAQLAIIGGQMQNMVAVAGGATSAAAGMVEAAGLLSDGADEVLLVCYDEPLPSPYEGFADEPQALYAWAWRVAAPDADPSRPAFELRWRKTQPDAVAQAQTLPMGLQVLQWMLGDAPRLEQSADGLTWCWSRDG